MFQRIPGRMTACLGALSIILLFANCSSSDSGGTSAPSCKVDADCSGATPFCGPGNECVAKCTTDHDCTAAGATVCNTGSGRCSDCRSDSDCHDPKGLCTVHGCAQCGSAALCTDGVPNCVAGTCSAKCLSDADCGGLPCDTKSTMCGCHTTADCGAGLCDTTDSKCVECLVDGDCPGAKCQTDHTCSTSCLQAGDPCVVDAECCAGFCDPTNLCQ